MFFTYILFSKKLGKYYIGSTRDLLERLNRHNHGRSNFTKRGIPWIIVYKEEYSTVEEAYKREMEIKSYKGGIQFKKLINW